jgi:hypothetical protein
MRSTVLVARVLNTMYIDRFEVEEERTAAWRSFYTKDLAGKCREGVFDVIAVC